MRVLYIGRKFKSIEGKGWFFLQQFWRLAIFYLLEQEGNRLVSKRFNKPKKEALERLHDVLKKSKLIDPDEEIVKGFKKLSSRIVQELLENSVHHLLELLETVPITEIDRPQDIGSTLIYRRWSEWELSIRDVARHPPAPGVKNKFSQVYWKRYFRDFDQKLTNLFFQNLIVNYESLISETETSELRRTVTLGYIEILRGFILDHPEWVFKSSYEPSVLNRLNSISFEECWGDCSTIILNTSIADYEKNMAIVLSKCLQKNGISISSELVFEVMKRCRDRIPEYYLGSVKDNRIDRIFLKSVRTTLINLPASGRKEVWDFLDTLQGDEREWTVIIPLKGFQFPAADIKFEDIFLRFTSNIDFLSRHLETRFLNMLEGFEEFAVIDKVSAMDPHMARHVAFKEIRQVLDLLCFILKEPGVIYPDPLSYVALKNGQNKAEKVSLLGGRIPELKSWKSPQNLDMILKLRRLINYADGDDADKLRRALRWYSKSLSEVDDEVKFLELWVPFELLGGGSYLYKENIPIIWAEHYVSERWSLLTTKQRFQTIYGERKQAKKLVDSLAKIRSELLVHAGKTDLLQLSHSVERLHDIVRFLINAIFAYLAYKSNKKEPVSNLTAEIVEEIDGIRDLN